jgi:predicted CoA-binding protein
VGSGSSFACSIRLNTTLTPEQRALYQNEDVIRDLLDSAKNIAIVGLSTDSQKASYFVGSYLAHEGYNVIPVNPRATEILGRKAYPDLLSIPDKVDVVDIFRPVEEIPRITDQAIQIKARGLWLQLRLIDIESAERARAAGLAVVVDRCVKMEHGRYRGGLHWAGMNTEIISARRAGAS